MLTNPTVPSDPWWWTRLFNFIFQKAASSHIDGAEGAVSDDEDEMYLMADDTGRSPAQTCCCFFSDMFGSRVSSRDSQQIMIEVDRSQSKKPSDKSHQA